MRRKYSEDELTRAILLIIDQGVSPVEVSQQTGINLRTLQRYKSKFVGNKSEIIPVTVPAVSFSKETTVPNAEVEKKLDDTLIERAKFLDDLFEAKKILLQQITKLGKKSQNLDALQRSLKTLSDIENVVEPEGDKTPGIHAKTVNMFQFFNQQLIEDGYKGPELTDADIVKGD